MNTTPTFTVTLTSFYEVEFCTHVDHPEKRDASFVRRDVHKQVNRDRFQSQGAAVGYFNQIVNGQWDFSSEYVCWVQVYHVRPHKRARCVRKRVDRERPERWVYDHNPAPEGTSAWSLNDGNPAVYCKTCNKWMDDGVACEHVKQEELEAWLALGSAGREILAGRAA